MTEETHPTGDQAVEPQRGNGHRTSRHARKRVERQRSALAIFAIVALAVIVRIAMPVGMGILLGTLVAFTLESFYNKLLARGWRPLLAALTCLAITIFGVVGVVGGTLYIFVSRGVVVAEDLLASLGPEGSARAFILRLSSHLPRELQVQQLIARLHNAAAGLASRVGVIAETILNVTFSGLLSSLFMLLTTYFVLRNWPLLAKRAEDVLPLRPRYTRALLDEFRVVGRTTLLGTIVTGLAQGALATLGYWILGVPEPAFLGAATALASLLPAVGTMLVWVPVGLFLILTGHVARGVIELVYGGLVVVGFSDYILRPKLVGSSTEMPALFTLVSLFGGIEIFGLVGLILGPVLMSLALAILRIYAQERRPQEV